MIVHIVKIKQLIYLSFWIVLVPNFKGAHIRHVEVGAVFALVVVQPFETVALVNSKVLPLCNLFHLLG